MDSGALLTSACFLHGCLSCRKLNDGERYIYVGDENTVEVETIVAQDWPIQQTSVFSLFKFVFLHLIMHANYNDIVIKNIYIYKYKMLIFIHFYI